MITIISHVEDKGHVRKVNIEFSRSENNVSINSSKDTNRNTVMQMFRCPWRFCSFDCQRIKTAKAHLLAKHGCSDDVAREYVNRSNLVR